jgi:hypothetical protein
MCTATLRSDVSHDLSMGFSPGIGLGILYHHMLPRSLRLPSPFRARPLRVDAFGSAAGRLLGGVIFILDSVSHWTIGDSTVHLSRLVSVACFLKT